MPDDIQVLPSPPVRNQAHHFVGLAFMALNMVRHKLRGYRTPRRHTTNDAAQAVAYDQAVVRNWRTHLEHYLGNTNPFAGRRVLEIGPGPDVGTGLFCLANGATSYLAVDAHALVHRDERDFHRDLARLITKETQCSEKLTTFLLKQAELFLNEDPDSLLTYRHLPNFDLAQIEPESVDLVVSHSCFEHLGDVERSFAQLTASLRPGAVLVSEIDLQTHTRWIRDADPLNIYRYRHRLYRSLAFSGTPNRLRPDSYLNYLESQGWGNFRLYPRRVLESSYVRRVEPTLHSRFRGDIEQLGWLSVVLCATRRGKQRRRATT